MHEVKKTSLSYCWTWSKPLAFGQGDSTSWWDEYPCTSRFNWECTSKCKAIWLWIGARSN